MEIEVDYNKAGYNILHSLVICCVVYQWSQSRSGQ
jgi:hypothetical protein